MDETLEILPMITQKLQQTASSGPFLASIQTVLIICGIVLALWLYDRTDIPRIQNLPSVPGLPILGNLAQLGTEQPRSLAELSEEYGPVFQIRLGNKVRHL